MKMLFELRALLEEFGVEYWRQGCEDFLTLVMALYLDMRLDVAFHGEGEYHLKAELDALAKRRGMPLKWLYAEMRAALLPLIEAPVEALEARDIHAPSPKLRTVPRMAVALAQWAEDCYG